MDVFLLSSGIGKQNPTLQTELELATAATNVEGFIRMTNAAYHFFKKQGHGHLAVISSIADWSLARQSISLLLHLWVR